MSNARDYGSRRPAGAFSDRRFCPCSRSLTYDRHLGHAYSYDVVTLGYNYRIDEIRSALGIEQLKKLNANNALRKERTERYWKALANHGCELPFSSTRGDPCYYIFPMLLPPGTDRRAFIDALRSEGIQTSIHYPPTHLFSYYRSRYGMVQLPITEEVAAREITLPLYPTMSLDLVDLVIELVIHALS
jgi:dTDP-4-amino-4,6-dideoxygalactose transaminase